MASRKEYEMLFQLNAQMGSGFDGTFSRAQQQIASMQREIQSLNSLQSDIAAFQKQQSAVEATRQKLEMLQKQYDNIQQEIKETEGFSSSLENKLLAKQQQIDKTSASLERETGKLNEMDAALQSAGVDTDNLSTSSASLATQIDELKTKQEETAQGAQSFGETSVAAFGAIQQAIVAAGIATALKEIYDAYMDCVNLAGDFEETMSTVEALSGANGAEMAQLNTLAKELGATTKFTAIESGEAMTYMGMAGWNAAQMMSGMDGVLKLAAASGEDLALVSDIVTDNLTAFGLKASDTARFADILAAAATNSNTSVSIMGETFKMSASIAGALGYSVEDVAVAVGLMANSGIKGSIAGTALKNTFNGLLEGVTLTADAFGEYEYTAVNADGTMKDFSSTINELRTYFDQMTEAERVNNAMTIAGQRGYNGLLAILNATNADYSTLTQSINECSGAAERMAAIKLDNLNGQLTLMNSAWDALKTTIGEQFNSEMRSLYSIGTDLFGLLNSFIQQHPALAKGIMTFVGVMGAAVAGMTAFVAITKVVIPLMQLFTSSIPGVNVIMGIAAGTAALAGLMVSLAEVTKSCKNETDGLTASSREQYLEIQRLEEEYARVSEAYGKNSQEALALYGELSHLRSEYESTKQSVEEFRAEMQAVSDAIEENNRNYQEAVSQIDDESYGVLALSARLRQLATDNDGSNAAQAEMLSIIQDLNEELPGLNLNMEDVVNNTDNVISAIEARAKAEIKAEKAGEAYKGYKESLATKMQAQDALTKATDEAAAAQRRLNEANSSNSMVTTGSGYHELKQAVAGLDMANEVVEQAQINFDEASAAAEELLNQYLELSGITPEVAEGMGELDNVINSTAQEVMILAAAYDEAYKSALESFQGQFGLFDTAQAEADATVANAQAALDSQLAFWQDYASNVEVLKSVSAEDLGVTQDNYDALMAYAQSGTEEAAGFAASLTEAINSGNAEAVATLANTIGQVEAARQQAAGQVAEWQTDFSNKMDEIVNKMHDSVTEMDVSPEAAQAATDTMNAYVESIRAGGASAVAAAQSIASQVAAALKAANTTINVGVSGPGAKYVGDGYATGTMSATPGWHLVGENGPEIVRFGGGETVYNANETREMLKAARDEMQIISFFPFMQRYMEASRGYTAAQQAEPISAQGMRSGDVRITVSPQFTIEGGTVDSMTEGKLRECAEIVTDMVMDAIEEAGIDAKRGAYA